MERRCGDTEAAQGLLTQTATIYEIAFELMSLFLVLPVVSVLSGALMACWEKDAV